METGRQLPRHFSTWPLKYIDFNGHEAEDSIDEDYDSDSDGYDDEEYDEEYEEEIVVIGRRNEDDSGSDSDSDSDSDSNHQINWNSVFNGVNNLFRASAAYGTATLVAAIISAPAAGTALVVGGSVVVVAFGTAAAVYATVGAFFDILVGLTGNKGPSESHIGDFLGIVGDVITQ